MFLLFLPHVFSLITTIIIFAGVLDIYNAHIILSVVSYGMLFAAFILSYMMSYQIKQLRSHNLSVITHFPALETSEKVLFGTIYLGFALLSVAIVNGLDVVEDLFSQQLVHKTVFALISWVVLLGLIILRLVTGLSDKRAITSVQISFILLIIGYFGTKIALEILR